MMKRVLTLLLTLMICLLISGCPKPTIPTPPEQIIVKTVYVYNECPRPETPIYKELVDTSHLGSAYNINTLVDNIKKMKSYNDGLIYSLECYEDQTENTNE